MNSEWDQGVLSLGSQDLRHCSISLCISASPRWVGFAATVAMHIVIAGTVVVVHTMSGWVSLPS